MFRKKTIFKFISPYKIFLRGKEGVSIGKSDSHANLMAQVQSWKECKKPDVVIHICKAITPTEQWEAERRSTLASSIWTGRSRVAAETRETLPQQGGRQEPVRTGCPDVTCMYAHAHTLISIKKF